MGTWGIGPFENDNAADWLFDFEPQPRGKLYGARALMHIERTLSDAVRDALSIEYGVAACEVLTWLLGRGRYDATLYSLGAWTRQQSPATRRAASRLVPLALVVLDYARKKELDWARPADARNYRRILNDISKRLVPSSRRSRRAK